MGGGGGVRSRLAGGHVEEVPRCHSACLRIRLCMSFFESEHSNGHKRSAVSEVRRGARVSIIVLQGNTHADYLAVVDS